MNIVLQAWAFCVKFFCSFPVKLDLEPPSWLTNDDLLLSADCAFGSVLAEILTVDFESGEAFCILESC